MNFSKKMAVAAFLISAPVLANIPNKYTKCDSQKIREPKGSTGYFWDQSCKTAYVLPPKTNTVRVDAFNSLVTEAECEGVYLLLDQYSKEIDQIQDSAELSVYEKRQLKLLMQTLVRTNTSLQKYTVSRIKLLEKKIDLQGKKVLVETQIVALKKNEDLNRYNIMQLENTLVKIESSMAQVNAKLEGLFEAETSLNEQLVATKMQVEELTTRESNTLDVISALLKKMNADLADMRSRNGGTVKVILENKHYELLNEFKRYNRGINLQRMPVDNSIQFAVNDIGGLVSEIEKDISIPGIMDQDNEVAPGFRSIVFGESLSGSVNISALSSCMILKGEKANKDLTAVFNVNSMYKYNLAVNNNYRLTYNKSEIYKKVKKHTTKGGLFKTKSINSISETTNIAGNLEVHFYSEDPRDNFSKEEKSKIMNDFVAKTIEEISTGYVRSNPAITLPEARRNGASVGSDMLKSKDCPSVYCKYAAMALDLSNSLFGSATQTSEFLRKFNYKSTEEVKETRAYSHYGTATFVSEE